MSAVRVTIAAFIDEYQPGSVECSLVDVHGRTWKFNEKVPVVSSEDCGLRANTRGKVQLHAQFWGVNPMPQAGRS